MFSLFSFSCSCSCTLEVAIDRVVIDHNRSRKLIDYDNIRSNNRPYVRTMVVGRIDHKIYTECLFSSAQTFGKIVPCRANRKRYGSMFPELDLSEDK